MSGVDPAGGPPIKTLYGCGHVGVTQATLKGVLPKVVVKMTPCSRRSDGEIQVSMHFIQTRLQPSITPGFMNPLTKKRLVTAVVSNLLGPWLLGTYNT